MSRKLYLKDGVSLVGLQIEMQVVLKEMDRLYAVEGENLWVTAGTDGQHSPGSLHYFGRALDFRTRFFSEAIALEIANKVRKLLPDNYDVVLHKGSHIHIEYDPK